MAHGPYIHSTVKIETTLYISSWGFAVSACQAGEFTPTEESPRTQIPRPSKKSTTDGTPLSGTVQPIPQLLSDSSIAITPESLNNPTVTRSRAVDVNLELLNESEIGAEIILNLFDEATFTAILGKKEFVFFEP